MNMPACHAILGIEDLPPAGDGGATVPDSGGSGDIPDGAYKDVDGDGIDGEIEAAYFVRPDGDDDNPGTMAKPFATIQYAIAQAAADPMRWQVLVAHGIYRESLVLSDGVGIFGQYDDGWRRDPGNLTVIDSPSHVGVLVQGISTSGYIEGFEIRIQDAPYETSAVVLAIQDVTGPFYVRHNRLVAGRGGDGLAGEDGVAGVNGKKGGDGSFPDHIPGAGGAAADGCSGKGGTGNRGKGKDGPDGIGGGGGGADGAAGKVGGNGSDSANGALPVEQSLGVRSGLGWQAKSGLPGGVGGCGGGGGGGAPHICPADPNLGLGGGGGGGGGAGGTGGTGGTGGGGSFGVFAIDAGAAHITDNIIETAGGGAGGAGGAGGVAGAGGVGGAGVFCVPAPAFSSGAGGRGGAGGAGGGGAGGAGGMSVGIHQSTSTGLIVDRNTYLLGPSGAGGAGGAGGSIDSGAASAGATGIDAEYLAAD